MRKLRNAILLLVAVLGVALVSSPTALAFNPFSGACVDRTAGKASAVCEQKSQTTNPLTGSGGTLTKVITVLDIVGGLIAIIFITIGGLKYILSGGDSAQTASAKNTIIYAAIGLVVAVLAQSIILFVLNKV